MPTFGENSLFLQLDLQGALQPAILPIVFAFSDDRRIWCDRYYSCRCRTKDLLDKDGQIINGGKALTSDSVSSLFSGLFGTAPAAVYIESAAGQPQAVKRYHRYRSWRIILIDVILPTTCLS